jgi:hypothetical protein
MRVLVITRCATGGSSPPGDVVGVPWTPPLPPIVLGIDLLDVRLQLLQSEDLPLIVVKDVTEILGLLKGVLPLNLFRLSRLRMLDVLVEVDRGLRASTHEVGTLLRLFGREFFHFICINSKI